MSFQVIGWTIYDVTFSFKWRLKGGTSVCCFDLH